MVCGVGVYRTVKENQLLSTTKTWNFTYRDHELKRLRHEGGLSENSPEKWFSFRKWRSTSRWIKQ